MKIAKKITAVFLLVLLCLPLYAPVKVSAAQTATVSAVESSASVEETETSAENETDESKSDKNTISANGVINTDDFEIKVVCGLDGNYRSGASIPITVYMKSLKNDFEGTVRVIMPGSSDYDTRAIAYEKEVLLSAGVQKVVTLSTSSTYSMTAFKFQVEDASGNIVIDKSVTMKSQTGDSALVGILSDDYTALNYFDGLAIILNSYQGIARVVELSEETMPEQTSGLDALSYLIINSYDTSVLSDEQLEAIENWVQRGGVLIIGTGSDYRRTLSGLQSDFIEGTIGGNIEGTLELDAEAVQPLEVTKEQGVVELSVKDGEPLSGVFRSSDDQQSVIWQKDCKLGHIIVTSFNLGMEPIVSWTTDTESDSPVKKMAALLLEKSANGYSDTRISELNYGSYAVDQWVLSDALDGLYNTIYPNMKMIGIMFLIFVIFIGPGLYLILKLFDKREWMWFLVPVLAIGFTAGLFVVTQDIRIQDPREASVTTLYYDMDSDDDSDSKVQARVDMAIQVPGAGEETVDLDSSLTELKAGGDSYNYNYNYYISQSQTQTYEYKNSIRETSQGYQIGIRNKETFGSTYLSLTRVMDEADTANTCGLDVQVERTAAGISGTVTNQTGYDLSCVALYSTSNMVMIGNLKAGESVDFTPEDCSIWEYDSYYSYITGVDSNSREAAQLRSIWNLFCNEYLYSIDEMDIYTYAYIGALDADYVTNEAVEENNFGVLVRRDRVGFSDYEDAKLLSLYNYAETSGNGWDSDGELYTSPMEVEFDLSNQLTTIYALVRAKDSDAKYGATDKVTIYGYNVESEQYEEIFTDGEIMEFEDGCPYLDVNGKIRLQFTCPDTSVWTYTPQITVVGGEF